MVEMVETGGNTISSFKRVSCSKRWCFTLNNYTDEELVEMVAILEVSCIRGIIGKEIGEEGTPHLQGYVVFEFVKRPMSIFKNKRIHWEKCKGSDKENIRYCSKDNNFVTHNIRVPKTIKTIQKLYDWQQKIVDICMEEPDDRTIHWYWESKGNIGKSALCKYLVVKHDALMVSGSATDVKYLLSICDTPPEIILWDIPRSKANYVSYTGMEEIKNGLFTNTKYECKMVVMNPPHIIVFANMEPDTINMSLDRWKITNL